MRGPDEFGHDDEGCLADECGVYVDAGKFQCRDIGTEDCDWCPYRTLVGSTVPGAEDVA